MQNEVKEEFRASGRVVLGECQSTGMLAFVVNVLTFVWCYFVHRNIVRALHRIKIVDSVAHQKEPTYCVRFELSLVAWCCRLTELQSLTCICTARTAAPH